MPEKLYFELPTDKWDIEIPENSPLNYEVEVAVYKWNSDIAVMIIVWKWGSTEWYSNKYVTIWNNLVKDHWVNVFVVENPWISWDDPELFVDCAVKFVNDKMREFWYKDHKTYVMWYSAWWHFLWRFSYKYPEIVKMLLVNPVLSVDFFKLQKWLEAFNWEMTIVEWDKDVDFFFNPLLAPFKDKATLVVLPWVNHIFSNEWWLETFIWLPEKYLFN